MGSADEKCHEDGCPRSILPSAIVAIPDLPLWSGVAGRHAVQRGGNPGDGIAMHSWRHTKLCSPPMSGDWKVDRTRRVESLRYKCVAPSLGAWQASAWPCRSIQSGIDVVVAGRGLVLHDDGRGVEAEGAQMVHATADSLAARAAAKGGILVHGRAQLGERGDDVRDWLGVAGAGREGTDGSAVVEAVTAPLGQEPGPGQGGCTVLLPSLFHE